MEKIYEQAKDLHVKNYIVYGGDPPTMVTWPDEDAGAFYDDSERKTVSNVHEVLDAFNKGILMVVGVLGPDDNYDDNARERVISATPIYASNGIIIDAWRFSTRNTSYLSLMPHEDTSNPEK